MRGTLFLITLLLLIDSCFLPIKFGPNAAHVNIIEAIFRANEVPLPTRIIRGDFTQPPGSDMQLMRKRIVKLAKKDFIKVRKAVRQDLGFVTPDDPQTICSIGTGICPCQIAGSNFFYFVTPRSSQFTGMYLEIPGRANLILTEDVIMVHGDEQKRFILNINDFMGDTLPDDSRIVFQFSHGVEVRFCIFYNKPTTFNGIDFGLKILNEESC